MYQFRFLSFSDSENYYCKMNKYCRKNNSISVALEHGKNDFAEISKNLVKYRAENNFTENNFTEPSK